MDIEKAKQLKKSADRIGQLVPVLTDKYGNIIDGYHRKAADINWKEVKLEYVDDEGKLLAIQLTSNWMRRTMKPEEKTRILTSLCEIYKDEWKGHYSREISKITGFDTDTIEQYLPPEYKQKKERRIPALDLSKKESIKQHLLKYGCDAVPFILNKVPMPSGLDLEFTKYRYNVWEASPQRPKEAGSASFHGATSPELAREILVRYSHKGELVLDNMAGSGTILDMCKKLNRECISYDLSPTRPEIKQGDARKLELSENYVDFAFTHFPYGNMIRYSPNLDGDLSTMPPKKFLEESRKVMAEVYRVLKPEKHYCVLIGDQRKDKKVIDWSTEFSVMGRQIFKLFDKIIWYVRGQSAFGYSYKELQAAEYNICLPTFATLLVFQKK